VQVFRQILIYPSTKNFLFTHQQNMIKVKVIHAELTSIKIIYLIKWLQSLLKNQI